MFPLLKRMAGIFPTQAYYLLWAGLGGGLGSLARYGFDHALSAANFPSGIWLANALGCVMIALFTVHEYRLGHHFRHFWATGICGGLTTFSAVNTQTLHYVQMGRPGMAFLETAGSLLLCLSCVGLTLFFFRRKENP